MPALEVGKVYHQGKTQWKEGTDFNYRSGVLELRLFFDRLGNRDIQAIRNGPATFALALLVLLNRIWVIQSSLPPVYLNSKHKRSTFSCS